MTQPRFVPVLDLPDDWSGAITVVVQQGQVRVLDEHPDDVAPGAPRQVLGTLDGAACWAVDLDGDGVPDVIVDGLVPLMGLYGRVDDVRWTLAGRAVQLVEWDRTTASAVAAARPPSRRPASGLGAARPAGSWPSPAWRRRSSRSSSGATRRCSPAGGPSRCRCTAASPGFVEPGETMEQAVHREVREEVGVELAEVRYVASQPWPFPHSLMIGFEAVWAAGDIVIDETEIVDAQWYRPDALPMIPPGMSIARTLIDRWLARAGVTARS